MGMKEPEWEGVGLVVGLIQHDYVEPGMMVRQSRTHGLQAFEKKQNKCRATFCHSGLKTSLKIKFRYLQEG